MSDDRCSGFLDDELTPDQRAAFEAELATSSQLRAELDEVRGVRTLVRGLPELSAPAEVFAIDGGTGDDVAERGSGRGWRVAAVAASVSIAAAIAAAVVAVPDDSPVPVQPRVAALTNAHGQSSTVGDPIFQLASETP